MIPMLQTSRNQSDSRWIIHEYADVFLWMAYNRIGSVLASMLISSTIDRGFELWLCQTKDYQVSIVEVINW
jgi:hypothetical protein